MKYPNFAEEKKLWRRGHKWVAGLDEAGRGPLAGPVIASAVAVKVKTQKLKLLNGLKDSKQLTARQREKFFKILTNHPQIKWGVGKVSEKVIDKINILEATKLAMAGAVKNLNKKLNNPQRSRLKSRRNSKNSGKTVVPNFHDRGNLVQQAQETRGLDFLIIDGNFKINSEIPQKSVVKADEKVFSCAAASIIAKVSRDRMMAKYHKKYPKYCFDRHKGYPTELHRKMIKKYGPCFIHRKTFAFFPVSGKISKG